MKTFIITKTVKAKNITQALQKEKDADVDEIREQKSQGKSFGFQQKEDDDSE